MRWHRKVDGVRDPDRNPNSKTNAKPEPVTFEVKGSGTLHLSGFWVNAHVGGLKGEEEEAEGEREEGLVGDAARNAGAASSDSDSDDDARCATAPAPSSAPKRARIDSEEDYGATVASPQYGGSQNSDSAGAKKSKKSKKKNKKKHPDA